MANKGIEFALGLLALVVGGALEELLPKLFGVGFPILLSVMLIVALRRSLSVAMLFAIAAGAVSDALSSLPPLTSVSFYALCVLGIRRLQPPPAVLTLVCAAYQVWLNVWVTDLQGSVFQRVLVALPMGAVTFYATLMVVILTERTTGVDDPE